jgi:hypothetical protein
VRWDASKAAKGPAGAPAPWSALDEELRAWRGATVNRGIKDTTNKLYWDRANIVEAVGGNAGYSGFLRFVFTNEQECRAKGIEPLRSSTLRQYKSACLHVTYVTDTPWTEAECQDVDIILHHREAKDLPKVQRGQLDWNKLLHCMVYARELGWHDVADGLLVIYSACTRQQDIKTATVENLEGLDTKTPTFWDDPKGRRSRHHSEGKVHAEPHCRPPSGRHPHCSC